MPYLMIQIHFWNISLAMAAGKHVDCYGEKYALETYRRIVQNIAKKY